MKIRIFHIDAFTDTLFAGNPAAVCPLESWIDDDVMQKIAMENNLAETAFFVKHNASYQIRWFTPTIEVNLCGHATLAAAFILFAGTCKNDQEITFISPRSGMLKVSRTGSLLTLHFPHDKYLPVLITEELTAGFNHVPIEAYKGNSDYLLVFQNETQISELIPRFELISRINARGIIVTAPGNSVDFVSRFFAPQSGINEDPVTGSAYTTLTPYWSSKLGKSELTALQLSSRKGYLICKQTLDWIEISGHACLYMTGEITI